MKYKNILIIKMSSLGDVIHALPFAAALRELYPQAKISWLVHPQFGGFLPEPPVINEIIYFDKVAFNKLGIIAKVKFLLAFRKDLHAKKFDLVIDLQGLFKSAVVAFLTGCPTKIGYAEMREGSALISQPIQGEHINDHVIERYLDVARYLGAKINKIEFPLPNIDIEERIMESKLEQLGLPGGQAYVVFVPGARWETKEWPPEYYADLANMVIADGDYVVLAGGPDEQEKARKIKTIYNSNKIIDLTGKTSLKELVALIKGAKVFISGDTGPLHFAAALKKPLIAMYGPTLPHRTGPYGSDKSVVLISPSKHAGSLIKRKCDGWSCMEDILPEKVYNEYKKLITKI